MTKPTFVGSSTCGWTVKQIQVLDKMNITNEINMCLVDTESKLSNGTHIPQCTNQQMQNVTAFPTWSSTTTTPGFRNEQQVNEIINGK